MSGFVAAEAVDPIVFDFRPYVDKHGTVPEPSDKDMTDYQNVLIKMAKDMNVVPGQSFDMTSLQDVDTDLMEKVYGRMVGAAVKVCGGAFTAEDLEALPFRVKVAFIQWLTGELSPEGLTPATR